MLNTRQAVPGEEAFVIKLAQEVFKPQMDKQFKRLFQKNNVNHMFVAVDHHEVVASVNYYPSIIHNSTYQFKVASMGAVCTKKEYRQKGLSSKLLELAEKKMRCEDIDFVIISGNRNLYHRFGAFDVGAMLHYVYRPKDYQHHYLVEPFDGNLKELYQLYQQENVKYHRSFDEFIDLYQGQTYPDEFQSYHTYVIYEEKEPKAYVILIDQLQSDILEIKEMAGSRKHLLETFFTMVQLHHKMMIDIKISINDEMKHLMTEKPSYITQWAMIKLISIEKMLDKINDSLKNLSLPMKLEHQQGTFCLTVEDKGYRINSDELHQLIFSGKYHMSLNKKHQEMLDQVIPIELPWSHNLNYQ